MTAIGKTFAGTITSLHAAPAVNSSREYDEVGAQFVHHLFARWTNGKPRIEITKEYIQAAGPTNADVDILVSCV